MCIRDRDNSAPIISILNITGGKVDKIGTPNHLILRSKYEHIAANKVAAVPNIISIAPVGLSPIIRPIALERRHPNANPGIAAGVDVYKRQDLAGLLLK